MSFPTRYAVLLDGGFLLRKLGERTRPRCFPDAADVEAVATAIAGHPCVAGLTRLRVYFYHAYPATGILRNPISGVETDLARTDVYQQHENLLKKAGAPISPAARLLRPDCEAQSFVCASQPRQFLTKEKHN